MTDKEHTRVPGYIEVTTSYGERMLIRVSEIRMVSDLTRCRELRLDNYKHPHVSVVDTFDDIVKGMKEATDA